MPDETIIPLNRTKIWLIAAGSLLLAAVGVWFLVIDTAAIGSLTDPGILHGIGLLGVAFFVGVGAVAVGKLRQSAAGLILNQEGVTDLSSGVAVGFVPWSDITGFDAHEARGQKFLSIMVRNPEAYVDRGSAVAQTMNAQNLKIHGTPITIPVSALRVYADELWTLINAYFDEHRQEI